MKKFFKEFGQFIAKGNVLDLAVALIIGTAFNAIVKSLVNDMLMPLISSLIKTNVSELKWVLIKEVMENGEVVKAAVTVNYGVFIQAIIDFLIIALSIFVILKVLIALRKRIEDANELIRKKVFNKDEEEDEEAVEVVETPLDTVEEVKVEPNNVEVLLTDIKDLLTTMNKKEE